MSVKETKLLLKQIQSKYSLYSLLNESDKVILTSLFFKINKEINKEVKISSILIVPKNKHKVFRFVLSDNSCFTYGVNKLANTSRSNKQQFIKECRNRISPQIKHYFFTKIKSGKVAKCKEKLVVDHVYPFSKLIEDYCIKYKLNLDTISKEDINYEQLIEDFAEFHRDNAVLQLLPQSVNAKKGNKLVGY